MLAKKETGKKTIGRRQPYIPEGSTSFAIFMASEVAIS
jgi:hypothetical protein